MYNECHSLTSRHKITLGRSRINQSLNYIGGEEKAACHMYTNEVEHPTTWVRLGSSKAVVPSEHIL